MSSSYVVRWIEPNTGGVVVVSVTDSGMAVLRPPCLHAVVSGGVLYADQATRAVESAKLLHGGRNGWWVGFCWAVVDVCTDTYISAEVGTENEQSNV